MPEKTAHKRTTRDKLTNRGFKKKTQQQQQQLSPEQNK